MGATQPRARGEVRLRADARDGTARLAGLRQAGSLRTLFPRHDGTALQVVLTNTSGGVTGGDRFRTEIAVSDAATVTLTTQAAERAYRAQPGETGRIDTALTARDTARINWLPQETILFDGCALERRLSLQLDRDASALVVEPVVFGRTAMGESVTRGAFGDRVEIRRDGAVQFLDRTRLTGAIADTLQRPHAEVVVAVDHQPLDVGIVGHALAQQPEAMLDPLRALLPPEGGASLVRPDLLVARLLAPDAFDLRRSLIPVIDALHEDTLPRPWMI